MKLEFYRQMFEKYSNINYHENPTVRAELLHGRTDRRMFEGKHKETN